MTDQASQAAPSSPPDRTREENLHERLEELDKQFDRDMRSLKDQVSAFTKAAAEKIRKHEKKEKVTG